MPNVRLLVEYNGRAFHGWQFQTGLRTIEEELRKAVQMALREDIRAVYASGRTDAGVHAKGQVVNFYCQSSPDLMRLKHSISNIMRGELSVIKADFVDDSFHARNSAISKQYSYVILNREAPAVLDHGRVWFVSCKLDIEKMQKEASLLVGKKDFRSFQGARCSSKTSIKTIFESEIISNPPYIVYRVVGDGFLKQMVRNITGTLVGLGKGNLKLKSMQEILDACNRKSAGVTAPAHGLCLDWVKY